MTPHSLDYLVWNKPSSQPPRPAEGDAEPACRAGFTSRAACEPVAKAGA